MKVYIKYVIAGLIASAVNLGLLYILTDIAGWHYLVSATGAFIVAYLVSFSLQKFWTFRDNSRDRLASQMTMYLIVGLTNLTINDVGLYILVDKFHVHYMIGQVFIGGSVAIGSFLVYRFFIFKRPAASV